MGKTQIAEALEAGLTIVEREAPTVQDRLDAALKEIKALKKERDTILAAGHAEKERQAQVFERKLSEAEARAKKAEAAMDTSAATAALFQTIQKLEGLSSLAQQAKSGTPDGQDHGHGDVDGEENPHTHAVFSKMGFALRAIATAGQTMLRDREVWNRQYKRRVTYKGTVSALEAAEVQFELARKAVEQGKDGAQSRLNQAEIEYTMWQVCHEEFAVPLDTLCRSIYDTARGEDSEQLFERIYGPATQAQSVAAEAVAATGMAEFRKLAAAK